MKDSLADKKCVPCRGGTPSLGSERIAELREQLDPSWKVVDEHRLERDFELDDFRQALALTNEVGELAEDQGHHPEIRLGWGKVGLSVWTHKIDGLTESDFVFAAKVDRLAK
jgi:4a-hydroxytetrahydrobiopterin dehydratase